MLFYWERTAIYILPVQDIPNNNVTKLMIKPPILTGLQVTNTKQVV